MKSIDNIKKSDFGERLTEFHGKYFLNLIGVSGAQKEHAEILVQEALKEGAWIRAYHRRMELPSGHKQALEEQTVALRDYSIQKLMSAAYGFFLEFQEDVEAYRVETLANDIKTLLENAIKMKVPQLIVAHAGTCFVIDDIDMDKEHKKLKTLIDKDMDVLDFLKASDKLGSTGWIGSP